MTLVVLGAVEMVLSSGLVYLTGTGRLTVSLSIILGLTLTVFYVHTYCPNLKQNISL